MAWFTSNSTTYFTKNILDFFVSTFNFFYDRITGGSWNSLTAKWNDTQVTWNSTGIDGESWEEANTDNWFTRN